MQMLRATSTRPKRRWYTVSFPLVLWIFLWCNLDTGFWDFVVPDSPGQWVVLIRAILPYFVLPTATLVLLRKSKFRLPPHAPSRLLFAYGLFTTLATVFSPQPDWAIYWAVAFLATILAAWTFLDRTDPLDSARQLLQVTWVAAFIVAAIIGYQARGTIFGEAANGAGVINDLSGLSRTSGVARWAAVPGLVCSVRMYHTRRFTLVAFYLTAAVVSFYIVYRMQSRGAIFGSVAALLFVLLVSSRMRKYALPFAILAIIVIFILDRPGAVSNHVATYLRRGETNEEFYSMTGRTRAYEHSITAIEDAPLFGRGQWADRLVIHEHAHNSFLQALLNGGIIGGIPYFASWIAGWYLFYRLQKRKARLRPDDRLHVLESGAVMMFFTVRAIPETTTASYAVDLLVMVAIYVYLECLWLHAGLERVRRVIRPYAQIPYWLKPGRAPVRAGVYRQL